MSGNVNIRQVDDAAGRERFMDLEFRLYRGDANWVPPLRSAQRKLLAGRTAFFEHAQMALFLAERDGRAVGRIAAIHNTAHTDRYHDGTGFFGFFEVEGALPLGAVPVSRCCETGTAPLGSEGDSPPSQRREGGQPPGETGAAPLLTARGTVPSSKKPEEGTAPLAVGGCPPSEPKGTAPDTEAAGALLKAAEQWLKARGLVAIRGPVNPSMNHTCGTLIDGFDRPPMALMPYNPPSYGPLLQSLGLGKCKDLYAYVITSDKWGIGTERGDRLVRLAAALRRRRSEVTLRRMSMKNYPEDILRFINIFEEARHDNWGCVPLSPKEILETAAEMRAVVDPNIIVLAEVEGKPVGAILAIPNFSPALQACGGRMWPFGWLRFMRRMKKVDQMRVFGIAVLKPYRPLGITALLFLEASLGAVAAGYHTAEASWVLEDNYLSNASIQNAIDPQRYKTYRLYEKPLK